jgi:hypothetical protein
MTAAMKAIGLEVDADNSPTLKKPKPKKKKRKDIVRSVTAEIFIKLGHLLQLVSEPLEPHTSMPTITGPSIVLLCTL